MNNTIAICESSIEEAFYTALDKIIAFEQGIGHTLDMVIEPQVKIGKYRVDFLVSYKPVPNVTKHVIVECDGHDFHEKTKSQAKMDKQRDRYLQGQGYHVLHFTGSELYQKPLKCAEEAFLQLTGHNSMACHLGGVGFE